MLTDPQPKPKKTKGFFDAFSSKSAFIAGLVIGILILCTIGFFILLTDNNPFSTSKEVTNQNQNSNVNQPTEPGNQPSAANLKMITSKDHVRGDISK